MDDGNGKQVDDVSVSSVGPSQSSMFEETADVLASSWGDELRSIVQTMDAAYETLRPRLNALIHAVEKRVVVP